MRSVSNARLINVALVLFCVFLFSRYIPVYYHSSKFADFLNEQVRSHTKFNLKERLIHRAATFGLPVRDDDIQIDTVGSVYHVAIDYRVPVNLLLFRHEISFHTSAAGFSAE